MSGIFFDSERDVGVVRVECLEEVIISVFGSFGKTVIYVSVVEWGERGGLGSYDILF